MPDNSKLFHQCTAPTVPPLMHLHSYPKKQCSPPVTESLTLPGSKPHSVQLVGAAEPSSQLSSQLPHISHTSNSSSIPRRDDGQQPGGSLDGLGISISMSRPPPWIGMASLTGGSTNDIWVPCPHLFKYDGRA
ncbi:hypothetical protein COCCADRAFT_30424 [Bipolaris zeicola 26-R-13]|uniref:Uncharacterized protein n=1 Tax=Cochliobolus carbonum (strain 26-R-13) TaxID=930089 RepID=W6YAY6_COCC2|nr:uncharacterized protein COCCADRAFT_30424 [Bipolaris zeicola 26-R-13]EUC28286.1 hypothetical protein COCCADRAFT_30424 [Bipolaris zeicola 26-R-13]